MFLYTNNEQSEGEMKKTILCTIASKRVKYLGINLTKEVKYLYSNNCKPLRKEIEEDIKNERVYHTHKLELLMLK